MVVQFVRNTFLALILLVGMTLTAQAQTFYQSLVNGGFEMDTAATGWNQSGAVSLAVETTGAQEGTNCAKLVVAAGKDQDTAPAFAQFRLWGPLNILGKSYRLSGWVKTQYGTGGTPSVTLAKVEKIGGVFPVAHVVYMDTRYGAQAAWTHVEGTFTITGGPATDPGSYTNNDFLGLRLYVNTMGVTGDSSVWLDNFTLTEVTLTPDPNNLLVNPGFEEGLAGWSHYPLTNLTKEVTFDAPHGGTRVMKATYPAGKDGQIYQYYRGDKFYKGSKLHFSAWAKATYASTGGWLALYRDIAINDAWGNYFGSSDQVLGNAAAWTKLQMDLDLPVGPDKGVPAPTTSYLSLRICADATTVTGGDSIIYWDDVELSVIEVPVELSGFDIE